MLTSSAPTVHTMAIIRRYKFRCEYRSAALFRSQFWISFYCSALVRIWTKGWIRMPRCAPTSSTAIFNALNATLAFWIQKAVTVAVQPAVADVVLKLAIRYKIRIAIVLMMWEEKRLLVSFDAQMRRNTEISWQSHASKSYKNPLGTIFHQAIQSYQQLNPHANWC